MQSTGVGQIDPGKMENTQGPQGANSGTATSRGLHKSDQAKWEAKAKAELELLISEQVIARALQAINRLPASVASLSSEVGPWKYFKVFVHFNIVVVGLVRRRQEVNICNSVL